MRGEGTGVLVGIAGGNGGYVCCGYPGGAGGGAQTGRREGAGRVGGGEHVVGKAPAQQTEHGPVAFVGTAPEYHGTLAPVIAGERPEGLGERAYGVGAVGDGRCGGGGEYLVPAR